MVQFESSSPAKCVVHCKRMQNQKKNGTSKQRDSVWNRWFVNNEWFFKFSYLLNIVNAWQFTIWYSTVHKHISHISFVNFSCVKCKCKMLKKKRCNFNGKAVTMYNKRYGKQKQEKCYINTYHTLLKIVIRREK